MTRNNYPVNPAKALGVELSPNWGGLSSEAVNELNEIIRAQYHVHKVTPVSQPSARFNYETDTNFSIQSGDTLPWQSVTVLGGDHPASAYWSSGAPHIMRVPESGLWLFEHNGSWLFTGAPTTWKVTFSHAESPANAGGSHASRPNSPVTGNTYQMSHSLLMALNENATVGLRWDHSNDNTLGHVPAYNRVTMVKVGPKN